MELPNDADDGHSSGPNQNEATSSVQLTLLSFEDAHD